MTRPAPTNPTPLELAILSVLWARQPLTVREVRDALAADPVNPRDLAFTSVITVLNIMVKKGQLTRTKPRGGGVHVYGTRVNRTDAAKRMFDSVIGAVFNGSYGAALVNMLENSDVSEEQLKDLRKLINEKLKENDK